MRNALREKLRAFRARHPSRLSRKQKTLRNVVSLLLLLLLGYRLAGCPPFTAMHAFRQAERRMLAGPSEVIARVPGDQVTVLEENLEQFGARTVFGTLNDWLAADLTRTREYIVGERDGKLYCFFWQDSAGGDLFDSTRSYLLLGDETGENTVLAFRKYISNGELKAAVLCIRTHMEEAVTAYAEVRAVVRSGETYLVNRCSGEETVYGDGVFIIAAYQCAEGEKTTQAAYEELDRALEARVVLKNAAGDVIWDETRII